VTLRCRIGLHDWQWRIRWGVEPLAVALGSSVTRSSGVGGHRVPLLRLDKWTTLRFGRQVPPEASPPVNDGPVASHLSTQTRHRAALAQTLPVHPRSCLSPLDGLSGALLASWKDIP
jgi:hypothetical protein